MRFMYFYKDKELFLYLRNMKENVPVIYAAPLQGFTEAAWRNAHAHVLEVWRLITRLLCGWRRELSATRTSVMCRPLRIWCPG